MECPDLDSKFEEKIEMVENHKNLCLSLLSDGHWKSSCLGIKITMTKQTRKYLKRSVISLKTQKSSKRTKVSNVTAYLLNYVVSALLLIYV